MKILKQIVLGALVLSGLNGAMNASAAIVLDLSGQPPVPAPVYIAASQYNGNPSSAQVAAAAGISVTQLGNSLYTFTPSDSSEEGSLSGSYTSTHTAAGSPNPTNYETLTITYDCASLPYLGVTALVVKNGTAGAYVWNLIGWWNGTDTLQIINDFLEKPSGNMQLQNISHASFFGNSIENTLPIPEPATYGVLAGAGLVLVSLRSQFRRK